MRDSKLGSQHSTLVSLVREESHLLPTFCSHLHSLQLSRVQRHPWASLFTALPSPQVPPRQPVSDRGRQTGSTQNPRVPRAQTSPGFCPWSDHISDISGPTSFVARPQAPPDLSSSVLSPVGTALPVRLPPPWCSAAMPVGAAIFPVPGVGEGRKEGLIIKHNQLRVGFP